jgi:hypothetical protein
VKNEESFFNNSTSKSEDCPICYETFFDAGGDEEIGNNSKERLLVQGCDHEFCRACLTEHCKHAVSVKEIPIACPATAEHDCENIFQEEQVKDLLCRLDTTQYGSIPNGVSFGSAATTDWDRFLKFQRMLKDPALICCSKCDQLFCKNENQTSLSVSQITCPSCGHQFCSLHGDVHSNKTCEEYASSKGARQVQKSEKAIRDFTKPCSHCKAPIEKESGCDHIVCLSCKDDMCFKCGTHVHLSGGMIRTCENCKQNYVDHRHAWAYRFTLCLSLPLYLPCCIIHVLLTGLIAILSCGCCFCLGCGTQIKEKDGSTASRSCNPLYGTRVVLAIVFLPVLNLARQCGLSCCCELDVSGIAAVSDTMMLDDEESDEEGSDGTIPQP